MTTNKKLSNFTPANFQMIREAVQYNLEHLKVDLTLQRMDFFRDNADPICAMINGYIRLGKTVYGDYGEYKSSCYASQSAYGQLLTNGWKTQKNILVFEHVIPIDCAGKYILSIWNRRKNNFSPPISDRRLLKLLNALIIPCVITHGEDCKIPKPFNSSMPPRWKRGRDCNWERYNQTPLLPSGTLLDQIVALRPGIASQPKTKHLPTKINCYPPIVDWPPLIDDRLNILL